MPKEIERKLIEYAKKKGWVKVVKGKTVLTERGRRYVYGTLRKLGWRPPRERK